MKALLIIILFFVSQLMFAQPSNDNCDAPEILCQGNNIPGNTNGATNNICATCEDGATSSGITCFTFERTVWYQFSTGAAGGDVSINLTGVTCSGVGNDISGIVYQAGTPCDASTYTQVSNCEALSSVGFSLTSTGLAPNSTYYVQVSSGKDCNFSIEAAGPGLVSGAPTVVIGSPIFPATCENESFTFNSTLTNCGDPIYDWKINGSTVQTEGATYTSSSYQDNDQIELSVTCACGFIVTSNTETMIVIPSVVDAGEDQIISLGSTVNLNGSGGTSPVWTPSSSLDDANSFSPTASPSNTTTYYLTVEDGTSGCIFTDSVTLTIIDSVTIPNTFTPNGDGVNDTWEIERIESFPTVKITIYDRWGQQVYKTIGYPESKWWNGKKGGKKLPTSTYYYVIDLNTNGEEQELLTGSVTIVY